MIWKCDGAEEQARYAEEIGDENGSEYLKLIAKGIRYTVPKRITCTARQPRPTARPLP